MLLLIKRNTAICKLASLQGYKKKRKMNEFKEKKNGEGRFLRLPRLSYRDETIRVTFAMWYTLAAALWQNTELSGVKEKVPIFPFHFWGPVLRASQLLNN